MLQRNIASRYATALFLAARDKDQLEAVEAVFPDIVALIDADADLAQFLTHPAIAPDGKKSVLTAIMDKAGDRKSDLLLDFLFLVVDKKREEYISLMADVFEQRLKEHRSQIVAQVETPYELSDALKAGLVEKLGKVTGKTVLLEEMVDPELMGGVRIRLGDRVIDGTVMHRLDQLKETLKAVKV